MTIDFKRTSLKLKKRVRGVMNMQLGESMEDYLEAILVLSKCLDHVRSVDVASYLGFLSLASHTP